MAIEVTVPRLGWSMDEGTLTEWLKRDGEFVRKGDMLFVLEGDKAAQEIESFDEGILKLLPGGPQPGDAVRVGQLLAYLLADGEQLPQAGSNLSDQARSQINSAHAPRPTVTERISAHGPIEDSPQRASPRARRRAVETGMDWTKVAGTGRNGRVREKDILAAAGMLGTSETVEPHDIVSHSVIRRTIADRMLHSQQSTAPVTLTSTADATQIVELRKEYQIAAGSSSAVVPSFTDFIVKLTAAALQAHPALNSRWDDRGIIHLKEIHIGIAVDTESGLLVPVVRNVPQLSLIALASRTQELIAKSRSRRLTANDLQGGTFTVTNLGSYGIDAFTPIIQLQQCAILGIGRIYQAPVFRGGQFVPRETITLSLTFDHRIVDGAPAARFLQAVCKGIENPDDKLE